MTEIKISTTIIGMNTAGCYGEDAGTFQLKVGKVFYNTRRCIEINGLMFSTLRKKQYTVKAVKTVDAGHADKQYAGIDRRDENHIEDIVSSICKMIWKHNGVKHYINDVLCVTNTKKIIKQPTYTEILRHSVSKQIRWTTYKPELQINNHVIKFVCGDLLETFVSGPIITYYFYVYIKIVCTHNGDSFKRYFKCCLSGCHSDDEYFANNLFSVTQMSKYHKVITKQQQGFTKLLGIKMCERAGPIIVKEGNYFYSKSEWKMLTRCKSEDFNEDWQEVETLIKKIGIVIIGRDIFAMNITAFCNQEYREDKMSSMISETGRPILNNDSFTRMIMVNISNICYFSNQNEDRYEIVVPCAEITGAQYYGLIAKITIDKK